MLKHLSFFPISTGEPVPTFCGLSVDVGHVHHPRRLRRQLIGAVRFQKYGGYRWWDYCL